MRKPRGTTNRNRRGNSRDREARRAYLLRTFEADVPGYCRCYRCGRLLHPDADKASMVAPDYVSNVGFAYVVLLTVDRIVPGANGGTYRRSNIRPACGWCNSETGGSVRR